MPIYVTPDAVATFVDGSGLCVWAELSHITLWVFVAMAAYRRNWLGLALGTLLTLVSMFYHGCQCSQRCLGLTLPTWQFLDHGTAPQAIIIIGFIFTINLYVGRTTASRMLSYTVVALTLQMGALYITLDAHRLDIAPTLVTICLVGAGLVLYYGVFRTEQRRRPDHPKFLAPNGSYAVPIVLFVGGILTTGIAVFFFTLTDPSSTLHSFWHFFVGIGLILLQEAAFMHPASPELLHRDPAHQETMMTLVRSLTDERDAILSEFIT
jgi:predicted membrane channel-forming protein YqfA (hemolysin III family)